VMSALETKEPHFINFAQSKREIEFEVAIRHAHVFEVSLEPICIAEMTVERRGTLSAQPGYREVDQSVVRHEVALHSEKSRDDCIDPFWTIRFNGMPECS